MNGKMVGSKPLYVALAQRKEDRKAKLQVNIFLHGSLMYTACVDGEKSGKCSIILSYMLPHILHLISCVNI